MTRVLIVYTQKKIPLEIVIRDELTQLIQFRQSASDWQSAMGVILSGCVQGLCSVQALPISIHITKRRIIEPAEELTTTT